MGIISDSLTKALQLKGYLDNLKFEAEQREQGRQLLDMTLQERQARLAENKRQAQAHDLDMMLKLHSGGARPFAGSAMEKLWNPRQVVDTGVGAFSLPTEQESIARAARTKEAMSRADAVGRGEEQISFPGEMFPRTVPRTDVIQGLTLRQKMMGPLEVSPGASLVDPQTRQAFFTAPNKPETVNTRPISVAPGSTLINPQTGLPIFTAPERAPKVADPQVAVEKMKGDRDSLRKEAQSLETEAKRLDDAGESGGPELRATAARKKAEADGVQKQIKRSKKTSRRAPVTAQALSAAEYEQQVSKYGQAAVDAWLQKRGITVQ